MLRRALPLKILLNRLTLRSLRLGTRMPQLLSVPNISTNTNRRYSTFNPLLPDKNNSDSQFDEMMDDRTNSLFKSLGIDAAELERQYNAIDPQPDKEKSSDEPKLANSTENSIRKPSNDSLDDIEHVADADPRVNAELQFTLTKSPTKSSPATSSNYHIDTQDIFAELRESGLPRGQAELIMRIIQSLITELVETCRKQGVPDSAAANEAYLFDAASSEVRNEISVSRQTQATIFRSALARLQRDVEILEHTATEMTNMLKSDMEFEVHERKNSARGEENVIQLKIQELNNKISTRLNSDLKSELENLRWQITRRSLTAIALVAGLFIWITQTTSNKKVAKTEDQQRKATGSPIPVHILAPSMSASDETPFENSGAPEVADLNSLAAPPSLINSEASDRSEVSSNRSIEFSEKNSGSHDH